MIVRRALVAASVASLTFASFAGCSQDPPEPARTASACSPRNAEVTWSAGSQGKFVLVGSYLLRYSKPSQAWETLGNTPVDVDPVWDDDGLSAIATTAEQRRNWQAALLAAAARTGQAQGQFGGEFTLPEESPARPSRPDNNTYVSTVSVHLHTMPFTIQCPGGRVRVAGTVSAPEYFEVNTALYVCGEPATSNESRVALGYCR